MQSAAGEKNGDGLSWSGPRGRVFLVMEAPHLVRIVMEGYVNGQVGTSAARALDAILRGATRCHAFWDLEAMVSYESAVRIECTRALLDNPGRVGAIQALARSKVVRMGVAVANLALQNRITMYMERGPFEAALREHVLNP